MRLRYLRLRYLRLRYAGIDRRMAASLHARNGDFHGAALRTGRRGKAFEIAFEGQHRFR